MLKEITRKVLSYCEIPQEIREKSSMLNETSPDVYVELNITSREEQPKYDDDFLLENWIIEKYPELEGQDIFIHIDY